MVDSINDTDRYEETNFIKTFFKHQNLFIEYFWYFIS